MAYLADFAYDERIADESLTTPPQELRDLDFDRISVFHNGLVDGWAYIVEGKDLIVLAFRGTQSKLNWETNFRTSLLNPGPGTDNKLRVHEGFLKAFNLLSDGERGIKGKMDEIKRRNGNIPIYITGHSLGGALAQIASAVLGDDQVAACYTFGSPRVGNIYLDQWVKVPSYRIMNYADIVPQIPLPIIYRHSGDPRYMPKKLKFSPYRFEPNPFERAWQSVRGIVQFLKTWSILGIEDHSMTKYCDQLDGIVVKRNPKKDLNAAAADSRAPVSAGQSQTAPRSVASL